MSFADQSLEEIESNLKNSDFQWIKGEDVGKIEKFKGIVEEAGNKFLTFHGGGRINLNLLNEFMDTFPSSPVRFDSAPSVEALKPQKRGTVNSVDYSSTASVGVEESPIYKLLKKQKPNWVNVNINLKLNLPTKSLYNVLITSFEDAESEIVNYITEGVEIEDIKNAIAESIKISFYESKKNHSSPKNIKTPTEDESED